MCVCVRQREREFAAAHASLCQCLCVSVSLCMLLFLFLKEEGVSLVNISPTLRPNSSAETSFESQFIFGQIEEILKWKERWLVSEL